MCGKELPHGAALGGMTSFGMGTGERSVGAGRVAATRLYDLAYEIDLDRLEQDFRESATRLTFVRARPKAVSYARAPVDINLGPTQLQLGDRQAEADVTARIYGFGAARLSFAVSADGLEWSEYERLVDDMSRLLERASPWADDIDRVRELIAPALEKPTSTGIEVDYVFATVRSFDPPLAGEDVLEELDLVPVLTGDVRDLSERAHRDVLSHAYSYYRDDLVVISWSRALILEPAGDTDVADILAVAHAQLLEFRYYDERLDAELSRMYDRIEQARRAFSALARRRHASLARSLHALLAEVTEVSERIENALVVTEDVYLAKVYEAAIDQFRVRSWEAAVDKKLTIIRETYTALYDEAATARSEYLELAIVLLIVLEIVLAVLS
ncbi:MAG: hypothetical protein PVJ80_07240 [Gemmatimonadota bacterium]|jgi:hypothetical protein